jgi:hypothetical protein
MIAARSEGTVRAARNDAGGSRGERGLAFLPGSALHPTDSGNATTLS